MQPWQALNLRWATLLQCAARGSGREGDGRQLVLICLGGASFCFPTRKSFCVGRRSGQRDVDVGQREQWERVDKRSHPSVFNIFHLFYTCYLLAASACASLPLFVSFSLSSLPLALSLSATVNASVSSAAAAAATFG